MLRALPWMTGTPNLSEYVLANCFKLVFVTGQGPLFGIATDRKTVKSHTVGWSDIQDSGPAALNILDSPVPGRQAVPFRVSKYGNMY